MHDAKIRKRVAQGAKLIVVDPDTIRLADAANLHLQIKPGSDTLLLAGIINAMISENLIDASSVKVKGFDELKKSITEYKKEVIEEITGVPYSSIVEAAKLYGAARTPFIVYSTGITRNTYGADIVSQILNLSMLKPSTVLPVGPEGNSLGMSIMGLSPQYLPGLQADKNKIEKTYKVELPTAKGKDFKQMAKGGMKFIYAAGDIPLSLVAPTEKPSEFLVVHASHTNELTDKADVVLPAPSFIEQGGTVINIYGKIKNIKNAVKPEADVKAVWEILSELSVSMGYKMKYADISDVTGEIEKIISISGKKAPSFNPVAFRESEGIEEEAVGGMLRFSASVVTNSKVSQLFQVTV
ncbi:MAG: molybdopterin-dependent oxidoreductase [Nitrospirae bacterium]|nr:molybdopterin-dependent oxidoreductase [Nitrospirota bacterium]